MSQITRLEDLPNDLFLEIFEHLHAFDLFMAFASLNQRISAMLFFTQLHVVISKLHSYHQMKFLSTLLTDHVDQVISISLEDQLRDYSSVISYFFHEHTYINLRSCQFYSIYELSNLDHVIEKLQHLTKLVSFRIIQPKNRPLLHKTKRDITKTILTHTSSALRSIDLSFYHSHSDFAATVALNWTVTSLIMIFQDSHHHISIYTFLPILRHYRALRVLRIAVHNNVKCNSQHALLHALPSTYQSNPLISLAMRRFSLIIQIPCNFDALSFILRCMPNLHQLMITVLHFSSFSLGWRDVFDGQQWQQMLTTNTPDLEIFNIFLHTDEQDLVPNVYAAINSFDCFTRKYADWYAAIHHSPPIGQIQSKLVGKRISHWIIYDLERQICLRGLRRTKIEPCQNFSEARVNLCSFNLPLTTVANAPRHLCYSDITRLQIDIPVNRVIFQAQSIGQLFKNIDCLAIVLDSSAINLWEGFTYLFKICVNMDDIDQNERAEKIANLVDLTHITKLQIQPRNDISHLYSIKKILLVSSRLIDLSIGDVLIFSSILYNNHSLIPVFHRLQSLNLLSGYLPFPLHHAWKIIERFPSLIHLELYIDSLDFCRSLLNILLDGLPKLAHLKFHYTKNTLLGDGTCLINSILQRRHRAFPSHLNNSNEVCVKIIEKYMDIYLNSCTICARIS